MKESFQVMFRVCLLPPVLKHNLFLKILHRKPCLAPHIQIHVIQTIPYSHIHTLIRFVAIPHSEWIDWGMSSSKPQLNYPHQHQWKHNTLVPTITSAGISGHMNATCSFAPMDIAVSVRFIKYKVYRLLDVGLIFRSVRFIF